MCKKTDTIYKVYFHHLFCGELYLSDLIGEEVQSSEWLPKQSLIWLCKMHLHVWCSLGSSIAEMTVAWPLPLHCCHKACRLSMNNSTMLGKVRGSSKISVSSCQTTGGPSESGDLGRWKDVHQIAKELGGNQIM